MKCIPLLFGLCFASSLYASDKPNILFIAIDDLKPTIGAYGNEVPTPSIDRISNAGTTFLNAHCQQAVCGPSRASIMTGRRPDYTRVWDLKTMIRDIRPDIVTMPQHFKDNGYTSIGMGKIYDPRSVDKGADTVSWSEPFGQTWTLDYNETAGKPTAHYQDPRIHEMVKASGKTGWNAVNKYLFAKNAWPVAEAIDVPDDAYDDGAIAKGAVEALQTLSKQDAPFFLAVGFKKPHLPFVAPKKYWDQFDRSQIELAPYQSLAEGSPWYAAHNSEELRSYNGVPAEGDIPEEVQRILIHGYYACVAYIDAQIGMILDELEAQGLADNTIIVLWGDHGWHLGDHGLWCKHTNFEQATRVPFIIRAPGKTAGNLTQTPAELTDLFPTLCDLAGIDTPATLDGVSLTAALDSPDTDPRDYAISQWQRGKMMGYALRNKRYRYVAWYATGDQGYATADMTPDATELYDYEIDPLETRSLVKDETYSEVAAELSAQLTDFLKTQNIN
ncbi:MAG: sulfatase [Puniceicoccaceae bacterium]|nr:sulfatase [Puniceicoccaceae bacterium]